MSHTFVAFSTYEIFCTQRRHQFSVNEKTSFTRRSKRQTERERERQTDRERDREREREMDQEIEGCSIGGNVPASKIETPIKNLAAMRRVRNTRR